MAERLTELSIPIPFDLNEELVFLNREGDVCCETVRQILLGGGNAHAAWISKRFVCRCRLVDAGQDNASTAGASGPGSASSDGACFVLDRGTEASLRNAEVAVKALIEAASELVDTLQATENRILELSNDASFVRWYEKESNPESRDSHREIVSQICATLREEQERDE